MVRTSKDAPEGMMTFGVIAMLMLGNVAAFLWCSWAVQKQASWYRFGVAAVLAVNLLLTFAYQFGLFDFLTLLLALALV